MCFILGTDETPYAQVLHVDLSHFFVADTPLIAVRSTSNSEAFEYVDSSDDERRAGALIQTGGTGDASVALRAYHRFTRKRSRS